MTSPAPNYEEMAALHALGLLDAPGTRELLAATDRDPEVRLLVRAFDETGAHLALEAPESSPPPGLRQDIMNALPPARGKVLHFSQWIPFAIAACLMVITLAQTAEIFRLTSGLHDLRTQYVASRGEAETLRQTNALMSLKLAVLDAKDPAYADAKVLVAWDSNQHRGTVDLTNLPAPPAGHDYQLWVLDPNAPSPVSAGVVTASRPFDTRKVSVPNPGFAISLEPAGGSPSPTGPILFAVARAE
jgi:anti-sigma-K factor RskA